MPPGCADAAGPPNAPSTAADASDTVMEVAPLVKEYPVGLKFIVVPDKDRLPVATTLPEMPVADGLSIVLVPDAKSEYINALVVMPGIVMGVVADVLMMLPLWMV